MEFQAEKSMEALQQLTSLKAKVLRDGNIQEIDTALVVPGDILLLDAGDMIQADGRIISAVALQTDEAALTGESLPIDKSAVELPENTPLAERTNMVYKGTIVRNGNAQVLVTATGMKSELGNIAGMVASAKDTSTPLEKKLEAFSKRLIGITIVIVVLIFVTGLLNKEPVLEMLKTAIALAVAAIPEGLPVVSTLALARGMMRMARQNVIVKKLAAVETLGATTVICTDKTGTLTENKMAITAIRMPGVHWESNAAKPQGENVELLKKVMALCNNATSDGIGDPIEVSMLQYLGDESEGIRKDYTKIDEIPFNSDTRVMVTLHRQSSDYFVAAKGATENLLEYCTEIRKEDAVIPFEASERTHWMKVTEHLAAIGLKTLAFACRNTDSESKDFSDNLVFLGIAGFMDPPRKGIKQVIGECHSAGIRVIMLTGDHPATAAHIAEGLGITTRKGVVTGNDLSDDAWMNTNVFARVSPEQKLSLIDALQKNHQIVAMTGDGVNDAPALKKADIGIAMGIRGTQVSQEVADMVLKDDAFNSIVMAIRQGRIIYTNIRRFIIFLLSCNLSELLIIGLIALAGWPFQLVAIQILFINLITDVFPAIALGFTAGDPLVMKRKPLDPSLPLISKKDWKHIWIYAAVISVTALAAAITAEHLRPGELDVKAANNVLFFTLIFSQLLHAFNMTVKNEPFFLGPLMRNRVLIFSVLLSIGVTVLCLAIPPVREALRLQFMPFDDWLLIIGFSILSVLLVKGIKHFILRV
jgi:Ca2+-transporting ATPase